MNRTVNRALMLGIVPVLAVALSACNDSEDNGMSGMNHGSTSSASAPATGSANAADVEFAQMMIVHHQQAVEMATLAETRASDAEVKSLAAQIKGAQQPEIDKMTGWLTAWGKSTAAPMGHDMMSMPGLMSEDDMKLLAAAQGTAFDKKFAQLMIAHHNGAIEMANSVLANGADQQVKALAQAIVSAQTAEVAQLQKIVARL
ncbi:MAG: DUF305 domain-containing protein [Hamadaea sp.]|uniref:DUF305 domain-containing protein n=1 Tax=Hamadaea sp. TaxID=2024425 RepID=UPI001824D327|nr:DUF305 domain-containing protein [Hamadaea sp.]NUR71049.1 DUF305 domain-containing protein [Hamadaea sp.]NUT24006.1 DUF305 domain-containing protein [Hamadaea sp.]